MKFTVTWTKSADVELGELWLSSQDKSGVSAASFEIDRILQDDAQLMGHEIAEGLRAINVPPLRFLFTADIDDRIVVIAVVKAI